MYSKALNGTLTAIRREVVDGDERISFSRLTVPVSRVFVGLVIGLVCREGNGLLRSYASPTTAR